MPPPSAPSNALPPHAPKTARCEAQVEHLHDALPALLDELERQGQPLTELRVHSATLEDVFVALTGRRLRDE